MPSIIIRPFAYAKETLISSSDTTVFNVELEEYLMSLQQYLNSTDDAPDDLSVLFDCLESFADRSDISPVKYSVISENATYENVQEAYCPVIFDSWTCWNASLPGTVQKQPCPDFPQWGWSPSRPAYKVCKETGEWWAYPNSTQSWSNYTLCSAVNIEFANTINIISLSGYCVSTCVLLLSLFTFFYFRALNCGRIKMHKNLFTSLTLNNMCWIIWLLDILLGQGIHSAENPLGCRLLHIIKTYFMLSTYFWMLCEGAYLHLLLKYTWGVKPWQMWCLVTAGWTLPAVSIIPYAYCRFDKNMCGITEPINEETESNCWTDYEGYTWFLAIPIIAVMVSNVAILISVIITITRKRTIRQSEDSNVVGGPNSIESSMKAARAALMLIPILGVHFLLLPMRPDSGTTLEYIYEIASAIASSYQGFFVSIIFCFLNTEVIDTYKRKLCRRRQNRRSFDGTFITRTHTTTSPMNKRNNLISMKHLPPGTGNKKATKEDSMEFLQDQLKIENIRNQVGNGKNQEKQPLHSRV